MNIDSYSDNLTIGDWDDRQKNKSNPSNTQIYFLIVSICALILVSAYFLMQGTRFVLVFYSFLATAAALVLFLIDLKSYKINVIGLKTHAKGILVRIEFWKPLREGFTSKTVPIPWANIDNISNSTDKKSAKIYIRLSGFPRIFPRGTLSSFDFAHFKNESEAKEAVNILKIKKAVFTSNELKSEADQNSTTTDNEISWTNKDESRHTLAGNTISRRWRMFSASLVVLNICAITWIFLTDLSIKGLTFAVSLLVFSVPLCYGAFKAKIIKTRLLQSQKENIKIQVVYWRGFEPGNVFHEIYVSWSNIESIDIVDSDWGYCIAIALYTSINLYGVNLSRIYLPESMSYSDVKRISDLLIVKKLEYETRANSMSRPCAGQAPKS